MADEEALEQGAQGGGEAVHVEGLDDLAPRGAEHGPPAVGRLVLAHPGRLAEHRADGVVPGGCVLERVAVMRPQRHRDAVPLTDVPVQVDLPRVGQAGPHDLEQVDVGERGDQVVEVLAAVVGGLEVLEHHRLGERSSRREVMEERAGGDAGACGDGGRGGGDRPAERQLVDEGDAGGDQAFARVADLRRRGGSIRGAHVRRP